MSAQERYVLPKCPECGENDIEERCRTSRRTPLDGAWFAHAGKLIRGDWGVPDDNDGWDDTIIVCNDCDYEGDLLDFFAPETLGVVTPGSSEDDPAVKAL